MDDAQIINAKNTPSDGVIFGVYGADDWVASTHLRNAIEGDENTIVEEGTWVTTDGWKLTAWIASVSDRYNSISMNRAIVFMPWGLIEASSSRGKLELEINGRPDEVKNFLAKMDADMKRAENLIEWVYGTRGESISVPLNYRAAIPGSYPWIKGDLFQYIDNYIDADASVLILIGPPGTGKTTFIKNLIHRSQGDAKVTYDEKVMNDDSLFAGFIESDTKFMIMEDADAFLKSRTDGNTMMHRFLNVSDGLISAADKKMVFSTNLPSIRDIDSALMRPGRCYDVLEFRALTRTEALVVAKELGIELPDGQEFTLAEMFHSQPSGEHQSVRRGMGFVG